MIIKIAVLILVITLVYLLFFRSSRSNVVKQEKPKKKRDEEIMVECGRCGTYISSQESIIGSDGNYYCSQECLKGP